MPVINEKVHYLESRGCVVLLALPCDMSICGFVSRFSPTRLSPPFLLAEALNAGMQQKLQKHVIF
jgi:hypothetical protein